MERESSFAFPPSPRARIVVGCILTLAVASTAVGGDDCWPKIADNILIGAPERSAQPLSVQLANEFHDAWLETAKAQGKRDQAEVPNPKAAVLCIDWDKVQRIPFLGFNTRFEQWFTAWEHPTAEAARQRALESCEKWRATKEGQAATCACVALMENDTVVLQAPDRVLRDYREGFASPYYFGWDRFQTATKHLIVMDAENGTVPNPPIVPTDAVTVRKPLPVVYPYTDVDYEAACWHLYTYLLVDAGRPDGGQLERLADLEKRGFYNCSTVAVDEAPTLKHDGDGPVETHCKLIKSIPLTGAFAEAVDFPEIVTEGLENAGIAPHFHTAWVELTVRLGTDNAPIDVLQGVRPVALVADDRLLLGGEVHWPQPPWACAVGAELPKREILYIAKCQGQDCVPKAMQTMIDSVLHGMELDPIAAKRFPNDGHPEEYQFRREIEQSLVLGGSFFEKSRYLVKIWSSDSPLMSLVYMRGAHRGTGTGSRLYVNVTQILNVAPNRLAEKYSEASEADVTKYEKALLKVVDASIARGCTTLGGTMTAGICEVNGGTK